MADDLRKVFGVGENRKGRETAAALEPDKLCEMIIEGGHTFIATWRKKQEKRADKPSSRR